MAMPGCATRILFNVFSTGRVAVAGKARRLGVVVILFLSMQWRLLTSNYPVAQNEQCSKASHESWCLYSFAQLLCLIN
ncbi:hypothetical protein [Sphingobium sp. SCG-1]|uniref:hypothetical protein n=1 Tax=Sphingobium sp. SCG-1 TaxID=2072936 RepID=UPI001670EBA2|nr:hypothetical protein [Sphingobium sp. SCG-1]